MLVIASVIFNLKFQFNKKISKTPQISLTTFQFISDFVYKKIVINSAIMKWTVSELSEKY